MWSKSLLPEVGQHCNWHVALSGQLDRQHDVQQRGCSPFTRPGNVGAVSTFGAVHTRGTLVLPAFVARRHHVQRHSMGATTGATKPKHSGRRHLGCTRWFPAQFHWWYHSTRRTTTFFTPDCTRHKTHALGTRLLFSWQQHRPLLSMAGIELRRQLERLDRPHERKLLQWHQYQIKTGCFVGNSVLGQCETSEKHNDDDWAKIAGRADALRRVLG